MYKRLDASGYATDKTIHYLKNYAEYFAPLVDKEIRLLELGVEKGGSLLLWRDYFEKGTIVGLDTNPVHIEDPTGRIHCYQRQQEDTHLLARIAQEMAPEGFDVIIEDCSHIGELTRISFWFLFDHHLKPGGLYAIEDWGTGYWNRWVDGREYKQKAESSSYSNRHLLVSSIGFLLKNKGGWLWTRRFSKLMHYRQKLTSHNYGMVGFIKELVDECGMGDIRRPD